MPRPRNDDRRIERVSNKKFKSIEDVDGIYAYGSGRGYGRWIDNNGAARSNGYNQDSTIEQPAYIIESIFRDEIFVERDLVITTKVTTTNSRINGLKYNVDDYYIGAEWFNVTTNHRSYVTDFTGSTKEIQINDVDVSMADNDKVYLTNVNGNNRIGAVSFDLVGNATDGKRDEWLFRKSQNQFEIASNIIDKLLYESHCMLFQSYNQYKLVALDSAVSADTWTNLLKIEGREFFSIRLTSLQNIFTSFKLNYHYDYGKGQYTREFYVDKNGYTSGGTVISATEKTLCSNAETNYRVKNNFEYSSDWIYDLTTAEYLLQKLVGWYSKQRLVIKWATPLHDSNFDYIKYELGDQVVLSNTRILPTGISGVKCFMITGKQIIIVRGSPYIIWNLIEMEDLPT